MIVQALLFLLGAFLLTFVLYPFVIDFLYKFQIREEVRHEGPKTHLAKRGTPTMAGAVFVFSVLIFNLLFNLSRPIYLLLFALVAAALLGSFEDFVKIYHKSELRRYVRKTITPIVTLSSFSWSIYNVLLFPWNVFREITRALGSHDEIGLQSYQKILIEMGIGLVAGVWFYFKLGWSEVWIPFFGFFDIGIFYIPLVVLMFGFFLNAISVTDGLDGLAGGLAVMAYLSLMVVAASFGLEHIALFSAVFAGALLAFLYFNIYPARVFMGNVGSFAIGATLVLTAFLIRREMALIIISGVFVIELLSVIIQVASVKLGRGRVFKMAPAHHHFEILGWPETKVTMRFWLAGALFSLLGILVALL